MVSRGDRISVLYPEYFDSNLTRAEGRRVPKDQAIPSPTVQDIEAIAKRMDLNPVVEKNISYPKRWWRSNGRVLVRKKYPKGKLLHFVAKRLSFKKSNEPPKKSSRRRVQ